MSKRMPRWPLALIAPAAAVAIWSGWVGLGELCGFGPVHVLRGRGGTPAHVPAAQAPAVVPPAAAGALNGHPRG